MAKEKLPVTPAIRALRGSNISYSLHPYDYEEKGGTSRAARELQVDEHHVIKTLIMEDENKSPLVVLMHGDRQVSTKELARQLGVKTIRPCDPETAHRHTGYLVGGTSPLGLKKPLPIYAEASIADLPLVYVNAGKRGLLARLAPVDLIRTTEAAPVSVAG